MWIRKPQVKLINGSMFTKLLNWIWPLLFLATLFYWSLTYQFFPEQVSSHMHIGNGLAEVSPKPFLSAIFLAITIVANLLFYVFSGQRLEGLPDSALTVPNRDYWLSDPHKRKELIQRLQSFMAAKAVVVNLAFLISLHMVFLKNGGKYLVMPDWMGVSLILVFVCALGIWGLKLLRKPT